MKNIHLVPTDQPSRLYLDSENNFNITDVEMKSGVKKHICITSDETIKEGDWVVTNGGLRFVTSINNDKSKTFTDDGSISKKSPSPYCDLEYYKKIILTTDQDLIKDGVQAIDDEFLEWFVNNPSCEWVEVGYGWIRLAETDNEGYWVSIPDKQFEMQQEEPKQETIEEAAEIIVTECYGSGGGEREMKKCFIMGAKWQQERMYSEEEVLALIRKYQDRFEGMIVNSFFVANWFEQFKKK